MKLLLCLLISLFYCPSSGEILKGVLDTTENWAFLARFCFLSQNGRFSFNVSYPQSYFGMKLLLYFDEEDQWPAVYKNDQMTCVEKTSAPHIVAARNQEIVLLPGLQYYWSGCKEITDSRDGRQLVQCAANRTFRSVRERWWYVAVSNCGDEKGILMDYELDLTNGDENDLFRYHFSADEFGILETDLSIFLLLMVLGVVTIICAVMLSKKKFLHSTYLMYMASLFLKIGSLFFLTVGYGAYANDGNPRKHYVITCIGRFIGIIAYVVFVIMLILIGKGFTVTRGKLRHHSEIILTIFSTIFALAIVLLYIVEFTLFDPGEVLYIYDFYFGIGLILLPVLGFFWLIYAVFFTLKHYPEKWKFYVPFVIFYGFWFLTLPIIVIASNFLIPDHMKEKVVNGVEMGVSLLGYTCFLLLTLPCCVNMVFPYHVSTNKIGVTTNAPHENSAGHGGSAYRTNNGTGGSTAQPTTYVISRETVTISSSAPNGTAPAAIAPNLAALFIVQNTHSNAGAGGEVYTASDNKMQEERERALSPPPAYAP